MAKFELSLKSTYVPTWTLNNSLREFLQNGVDAEKENPDNKFTVRFDNGVLYLHNELSTLEPATLLLGETTKGNGEFIGKHGEGMKLAILIALRLGKTLDIYIRDRNVKWACRLSKSIKYQREIPVIEETKVGLHQLPDDIPTTGLTVRMGNVTEEEFNAIDEIWVTPKAEYLYTRDGNGGVLADKSQAGNIYVNGLFVKNDSNFVYGYNFDSKQIDLDRDRRMVGDTDLRIATSRIWELGEGSSELADLLISQADDVMYIQYTRPLSKKGKHEETEKKVEQRLVEKYSEDVVVVPEGSAIPLSDIVKANPNKTVVGVNKSIYATVPEERKAKLFADEEELSLRDKILKWADNIQGVLTTTDKTSLQKILDEM